MAGKGSERLCVIFGGPSTEHDASLASARNVVAQLDRGRFPRLKVAYLPRSSSREFIDVPPNQIGAPEEQLLSLRRRPMSVFGEWVRGAFVFDLTHGHGGEDGTLAGFFDVLGIRSSTSKVLQPALTMAKWAAGPTVAALMRDTALRVPETLVLRGFSPDLPPHSPFANSAKVVVKPGELGASILTELLPWDPVRIADSVRRIHDFCATALIQERVVGREFSVGLFEVTGRMTALPVVEIQTPEDFFGHDLKHGAGAVESVVDDLTTRRLQQLSVLVAERIGVTGWCRIDWIVDTTETPFFLEVNYLPGLMQNSLYPAMLTSANYTISDLIAGLIDSEAAAQRLHSVFKYEVA